MTYVVLDDDLRRRRRRVRVRRILFFFCYHKPETFVKIRKLLLLQTTIYRYGLIIIFSSYYTIVQGPGVSADFWEFNKFFRAHREFRIFRTE